MKLLLLDPRLMSPPGHPEAPLNAPVEFWRRIIDWSADRRVRLGRECRALVASLYAEHGYPDRNLELSIPALRSAYQSALGRLLSQVLEHEYEADEQHFDPAYAGSELEHLALQLDVSGTANGRVVGIATSAEHWERTSDLVSIAPGPPADLHLCLVPGCELQVEQAARIIDYLAVRRIHIVGGRAEEPTIEKLVRIGCRAQEIHWITCEKSRPPRHLDETWGGLDPTRDITVCITSRIGHPTSIVARDITNKRGVPHLLVHYPRDLPDVLTAFVNSRLS